MKKITYSDAKKIVATRFAEFDLNQTQLQVFAFIWLNGYNEAMNEAAEILEEINKELNQETP